MSVDSYSQRVRIASPRMARDQRPQDLSGLGAAGQLIAEAGVQRAMAAKQDQLTAAKVRMIEGFAELEADLGTDPDGADMVGRYAARVSALKAEILPDDAPAALQDALAPAFAREAGTAHVRATQRAFRLGADNARANLNRGLDATRERLLRADNPALAERLLSDADGLISSVHEGGFITAEAAEQAQSAFRDQVSRGMAEKAIAADPQAAAIALGQEGAFDLPERERLRYAEAAQREADGRAAKAEAALGREVGVMVDALVSGLPTELGDLPARVEGTKYENELSVAIEARQVRGDFLKLSPQERADEIDTRSRAIGDRLDLQVVRMLRGVDDALSAAEAKSASDADRALAEEVRFAADVLLSGESPANLDALKARVEGTAYAAALARAESEAGILAAAPGDSARLRRATIDLIRDGGLADARDVQLLDGLIRIDEAARRQAAADPVAYGQSMGRVAPEAIEISDPDSVALRIAEARAFAQAQEAPVQYFSGAERDQIAQALDSAEASDRAAMAATIAANFGDAAPAVLAELGETDRLFAHAGNLQIATGAADVAAAILRGQDMLKAGDAPKLAKQDRDPLLADAMGAALAFAPPELRGVIGDAADAWFAANAHLSEPNDIGAQSDLFARGVQRVVGQTRRGGRLYGGFQEVNGDMALLPPELDADAVEDALERAGDAAWRAASAFGGAPRDGDKPVHPAGSEVILRATPGGAYMVGLRRRGRIEYLTDESSPNGYFHLDLSQLVALAPHSAAPLAPDTAPAP